MSTAILEQPKLADHIFADRTRIRQWADRLYAEGIEAGKQHSAEWDRMFGFEREELVAAELKQVLPTIKAGAVTLAEIYRAYTEAPAIFLESFGAGFSEANS